MAYIKSVGLVRIGRYFDRSYKDLALEAIEKALSDGGRPGYVVVSSMLAESALKQLDIGSVLAEWLGMAPVPAIRVEAGENSGLAAVEVGATIAEASGKDVLVVGVEKGTEYPTTKTYGDYSHILEWETETVRNVKPPDLAALAMEEYMRRYGVSREELAAWPVKMHRNAAKVPHAQLKFEIRADAVPAATKISGPLTLLDMFPIGDGAAAILISRERGNSPIEIAGAYASTGLRYYLRDDPLHLAATAEVLQKALELTGGEQALEIHDSYSIYAYLVLESAGLVPKGRAPAEVDGMEWVNVSGGLKARGHPFGATGVYQVAELFTLMTDGLGSRAYTGEWGVAHGMSGHDGNARVVVLRRV